MLKVSFVLFWYLYALLLGVILLPWMYHIGKDYQLFAISFFG